MMRPAKGTLSAEGDPVLGPAVNFAAASGRHHPSLAVVLGSKGVGQCPGVSAIRSIDAQIGRTLAV
jgi:hypothetical protein